MRHAHVSACLVNPPASPGTSHLCNTRPAEPAFRQAAAKAGLTIELVRPQELDGVYRCSDVDVLRLRRQG
jgi:hypothetical protein